MDMNVISADSIPHFNLDWTTGTLRVVEDSSFRFVFLLEEKTKNMIILSVKEVK